MLTDEIFKPLFKRNTDGSVQKWLIEVKGDSYRTIYGRLDGAMIVSEYTECEAKNTGRANSTTAEEQAISEAKSLYKKKLKSNFKENVGDIDEGIRFMPQLAHVYADHVKKLYLKNTVISDNTPYCVNLWSQPKLDGLRAIITKDGITSRNGEKFISCPHIEESFEHLFKVYPDLVLDGELYNHEYKDDFEELVSIIKKTTGLTPEDLQKSKDIVQFHCFDSVLNEHHHDNVKYIERRTHLQEMMKNPPMYYKEVDLVQVKTFKEMYDEYVRCMDLGYEGTILRQDILYTHKKTDKMLKYKEFTDDEFKLIEIENGRGKMKNKAKKAWFYNKDGQKFKADIVGKDAWLEQVWLDKETYYGTMCTVIFQNYTAYGIPRFGKVKELNRTDNL